MIPSFYNWLNGSHSATTKFMLHQSFKVASASPPGQIIIKVGMEQVTSLG